MLSAALWIDHDRAKIFLYSDERIVSHQLEREKHPHHHRHPKDAEKVPVERDPFFHAVAEKIGTATELLVLGPGEAKKQFKHHIESHHGELAKHIVGIETLDHPTEAQIAALGRKFFKNFHRTGLSASR